MQKLSSPPNTLDIFLRRLTFILVFFILIRPIVDADIWWHLRAGQVMWEHKKILLTDPFSYTRWGTSWVNAFWISEIILYLLYQIGGYLALAIFVSLTGAIAFYILYRRISGHPLIKSFVCIIAAITAAPIWGPRPQVISFIFVAILDSWLANKRPKWLLVPLFAIWANIHGGWIWGFLLLVAHITGTFVELYFAPDDEKSTIWHEAKGLLGWFALSALAIGINPNGLALWKLPFKQITVSMQIQEWLSPNFQNVDFHPFLWMIFLLLVTAPLAAKPDWRQVFKVIGFAYLTFVAQRNIALFALVAAPLLADWLNAIIETRFGQKHGVPNSNLNPRLRIWINSLLLISTAAACIGYLFTVLQTSKVDEHYPVEAVKWIKERQPQGRLFSSYNWGGYLLWNLPEYPVFIDGRADLYGSEIIDQWRQIVLAEENSFELLNQWDINLILLEPSWPIIKQLPSHGWVIIYEDKSAIILQRE